jgi:hypothetical protein
MLFVIALSLPVAAATIAAETHQPREGQKPAAGACADMMQQGGVTEEGKKAMREFMQSDRAPQAMATMMEMARRMGNGDVMLGMTRMMEMMGGGMMGGQGGMMGPGRQPGK